MTVFSLTYVTGRLGPIDHSTTNMSQHRRQKRLKVDSSNPLSDATEAIETNEEKVEENGIIDSLAIASDGRYRNKQRCLVLCSRGVTSRYRHFLEDLRTIMPHHKKESKLDPGNESMAQAVNEISQLRSCNTILFLECRKHTDCYMWISRAGTGPSVRFLVTNVHTMDELRLTGNCLKGSRPVLSFDRSFATYDHLKLIKELFIDVFGVPRGHPKSKPFVDRVMAFYYADKRVRYCDLLNPVS
jgi:ribosome biogenesis protein BRX1